MRKSASASPLMSTSRWISLPRGLSCWRKKWDKAEASGPHEKGSSLNRESSLTVLNLRAVFVPLCPMTACGGMGDGDHFRVTFHIPRCTMIYVGVSYTSFVTSQQKHKCDVARLLALKQSSQLTQRWKWKSQLLSRFINSSGPLLVPS